jgi:hypothetical protein
VNVVSGHYSNVRAGSPPVGSCRPAAGAEGQVRTTDSVQVGTLRTSSTPSVQQPPTPPHTPKTTGNNNSTTTGQTAHMPLGLYIWFYLSIYFTSGVSSCFDINQALTSRHCFSHWPFPHLSSCRQNQRFERSQRAFAGGPANAHALHIESRQIVDLQAIQGFRRFSQCRSSSHVGQSTGKVTIIPRSIFWKKISL